MDSLRHRITTGARWTLSVRVVERTIGFVSTLVLARLLAPDDFGVVAMGTAILGILNALTEFGFTKALIRMNRPQRAAFDSAYTLNVLMGVLIALAMVALIPLAIDWYADARVKPVLISLAVISLVASFRNVGLAKYERAMDFQPFFKLALARKLAAVGVGAVAALTLGDYRALLAGMGAGAITELVVSYRLTRFRPRFTLSQARQLLGFSLWWLASEVATMLGRRVQDLLVGQQLGASTLGNYSVAYDLATLPTTELVTPVMRAVYPGYMQIRDDVERLRTAFVRVWGAIALVAIPSAVGIACLADLLTNVVLGPKWAEASPLMGALAAVGALHALHSSYWPMLLTRVGPKTVFLLAAWGGLLTIPVFGGLLYFAGLLPAIGGGIACGIAMLMIGARMLLNDLGGSGIALIVALVRPAIASAVMAGSILSFRGWLPDYTTWSAGLAEMMMMIAFGVLVFTVAVAAMWLVAGRPKGAESELISLVLLRIGKNATNG